MKLLSYVRWAGYGSAIAWIVYIIFEAYAGLRLANSQFSWLFDSCVSEYAQAYCKAYITEQNITEPKLLFTTIAAQLPSSDALALRKMGHCRAHVNVHAAKPIVRVNDNLLLIDSQKLVPCNLYHQQALPATKIVVHDSTVLHGQVQDFAYFVKNIPQAMLDRFAITWKNKTEIHLIDADMPRITIIAWYQTRCTDQLMKSITQLYAMLVQRPSFKKYHWNIDVRSEHQIVVARRDREGL